MMRPCGCDDDYHMADCPIRTGEGYTPDPRDFDDDGYYDDHPPDGCE